MSRCRSARSSCRIIYIRVENNMGEREKKKENEQSQTLTTRRLNNGLNRIKIALGTRLKNIYQNLLMARKLFASLVMRIHSTVNICTSIFYE